MDRFRQKKSGFTLIEMIVSLGLFSVVITISVGALLVLVASNEQLQGEQSVMTNLSFALDSMTREIRTGTQYFCDSEPNYNAGPDKIFDDGNDIDVILMDSVADCPQGNDNNHTLHGIAFRESGDSITGSDERILYFFDADAGQIFRRVGNNDSQSIVSSGIFIEDAQFFVTGSEPFETALTDTVQPSVTIFIEATEVGDPTEKRYQIQTTVTQRILDL